MYGLQRVREREQFEKKNNNNKGSSKVINLTDNNNIVDATAGTPSTPSAAMGGSPDASAGDDIIAFQQTPFSAYQGKEFDAEELEDILVDWLPWITHTKHSTQQSLVDAAVGRIANGVADTLSPKHPLIQPLTRSDTHTNDPVTLLRSRLPPLSVLLSPYV